MSLFAAITAAAVRLLLPSPDKVVLLTRTRNCAVGPATRVLTVTSVPDTVAATTEPAEVLITLASAAAVGGNVS